MIPLAATTITKLIKASDIDRVFYINTNSTGLTKFGYTPDTLESDTGGFAIFGYGMVVHLPAGKEIFAYATQGTPTVTMSEIKGPYTNAIMLY